MRVATVSSATDRAQVEANAPPLAPAHPRVEMHAAAAVKSAQVPAAAANPTGDDGAAANRRDANNR
ncbi:hypothetical protein XFF6166_120070 [Xanthomonas citri pv. fuscans]|uniref:Uncharacterized protein n=1 Tax=Xanthomonas campestris pv. phaseoli TaxID=317013 RepID=A0A7Z7J5E7_XANCH|nr:hypothetical protein XFF6166_120070 [Xanthomonas citri pv. fuscans]SOO26381.1 hypothetical protein XFF6991_540041 [Xanthomonas phaseoli pv. phaseoli]SON94960.1 hypothetical protein XFF7767_10038 [Xanthomonas citri pv. fuscans]SON95809.1 hypothetical protein XFF6990_280035 [Xanthomonas citri pv. fuscans]SON99286.1 hypothetical protein XFF6960_160037 [Xanthomonas citri pv. fuscans]